VAFRLFILTFPAACAEHVCDSFCLCWGLFSDKICLKNIRLTVELICLGIYVSISNITHSGLRLPRKELKQQKVRFASQLDEAHKNASQLEAKVADMQFKIQKLEQELSVKQWNVESKDNIFKTFLGYLLIEFNIFQDCKVN